MRKTTTTGRIFCLDGEITLHDAQIIEFGQWSKRSVRASYAYGEWAWLQGKTPEKYCVRENRSIWFLGITFCPKSLWD